MPAFRSRLWKTIVLLSAFLRRLYAADRLIEKLLGPQVMSLFDVPATRLCKPPIQTMGPVIAEASVVVVT